MRGSLVALLASAIAGPAAAQTAAPRPQGAYFDGAGQWAVSGGYYDETGRWHDSSPAGHYDENGRWMESSAAGRYGPDGAWIPAPSAAAAQARRTGGPVPARSSARPAPSYPMYATGWGRAELAAEWRPQTRVREDRLQRVIDGDWASRRLDGAHARLALGELTAIRRLEDGYRSRPQAPPPFVDSQIEARLDDLDWRIRVWSAEARAGP